MELESKQVLAELCGVSKHYGSVPVLKNVDFQIRRGENHALLGGNGAGKSTLVKIMAGIGLASAGELKIGAQTVGRPSPARLQALGLYLVPQEAHIFPNQSVLENICIGLPLPASAYEKKVRGHIDELGVDLSTTDKAATLEIADRQILEILRGMVRDARVLILDEPSSALTPLEVEALFTRLRALKEAGVGLVFISHKLQEVRSICDWVSVLRDGELILSEPLATCPDEKILAAMNPRASSADARHLSQPGTAELLSLKNLGGEGFENISLGVRSGEIVGLTGVVGAGRTELAETVFGIRPMTSGTFEVDGQPVLDPSPRKVVDAGLVYLSEDRQQYGLFLDSALFWNTSSFVSHELPFFLRPSAEKSRFNTYRKAMDIRCESASQLARSLSGGNQQKVLLSKCLVAEPRVLILDEPTRGVDVGARNDIYRIIDDLVQKGTGVLLISSDFDEIIRLSDRILVMVDGLMAGELPGGAKPEEIARLAFGAREPAHA